jgi:hypothetical protein
VTTLYEKLPSSAAGTHVLAIGVGKYPHLIDGAGPLAANPLGLGQLTSPPVSVKALVDWFLAPLLAESAPGFQNADCPLMSLEGLISNDVLLQIATPNGVQAVDAATRSNIQDAFERWLARVASNEDNIGVFYFCGHGIMVADHYLLAEDFGKSAAVPWDRAFDISNTMRAVEREVKGTLYFLLDACREISRDIALSLGANPFALKAVDLKKQVKRKSISLIAATGEGKLAFGTAGKTSRFTDALLTALSGYSGVKAAGSNTWDVDGETIASAIRKLLENGNKAAQKPQVSEQAIGGSSVPLVKVTQAPKVKVQLDLTPEQMRAVARLTLTSAKGTSFQHEGANGIFRTEVPRGFYVIAARAQSQEFAELTYDDQELMPPIFEFVLQASP